MVKLGAFQNFADLTMSLSLPDLSRTSYRKLRSLKMRYFGEVGYITRQLHRLEVHVRERARIAKRRTLMAERSVSPQAVAIARDLAENGYHITTVAALGLDESVISSCRDLYTPYDSLDLAGVIAKRQGKGKRYWIDLYEEFGQQRMPVLDFLLSDIVLDVCGTYLSEVPVLDYITLLLTPPQGGTIADECRASQDWHLDNDRAQRVKVFMLPLGADAECGPTMFLPKKFSDPSNYRAFYPGYFTDQQFKQSGLDESRIVKFTGEPGAVLFFDTSTLFHCGSRTASKPRLMLCADFGPISTYLPHRTAARTIWPESCLPEINLEIMRKFGATRPKI